MSKYQQGKVYKIISPNTDKIYIGSTTEPTLACRLRKHKDQYRRWVAGKMKFCLGSFAIIEAGASSIILLESYPCTSRDELRAREQHHIDLHKANCANLVRAYVTQEQQRAHYNEHLVCTCGGKYTRSNFAVHCKSESHQKYLAGEAVDDAIQKRRAFAQGERGSKWQHTKVNCECGGRYTMGNKAGHLKTIIHMAHVGTPVLLGQ
jgi:hypothetical protein